VENLGVVSSTAATGWAVASSGILHLPPSVIAAGGAAVGAVAMGQSFKARAQARRAERKRRKGEGT
jgi:hypothetical protein